jgi:hypothetical protein
MASVLSAGTTSNTALNLSADTTGILQFQTNGTTPAMTINTSQQVGIGLTNPSAILHISSASQPYLKILYAAQREYALTVTGSTTSDGLAIRDESGSLEIARFCRGGNVGIGTSSPTQKLEVSGRVLADSLSAASAVYIWSQNRMSLGASYGIESQQNSPLFMLTQGVAQPIVFGTNGTERMRIDSSGNVGIGLNPSGNYQLEGGTGTSAASRGFNLMAVSGGFSGGDYPSIGYNFRTTASSGSYTYNATDTAARILFSNVGTTFSTAVSGTGGNAITWSERMRVNSSGNFLVGTTADITTGGTSVARVCFDSGSGQNGMKVRTNDTSYAAYISTTTASDHYFGYMNNSAGTNVGSIFCSNTTTTYNTGSDYRLKENVARMTGALARVQQLKPCTYTWKVDGSSGQGFIAHELQEVVPECVTGEKDAVNEDGSIKPQGVDTSFLIATLTAAIQELKAELDATKAEVQALKGAK